MSGGESLEAAVLAVRLEAVNAHLAQALMALDLADSAHARRMVKEGQAGVLTLRNEARATARAAEARVWSEAGMVPSEATIVPAWESTPLGARVWAWLTKGGQL